LGSSWGAIQTTELICLEFIINGEEEAGVSTFMGKVRSAHKPLRYPFVWTANII